MYKMDEKRAEGKGWMGGIINNLKKEKEKRPGQPNTKTLFYHLQNCSVR